MSNKIGKGRYLKPQNLSKEVFLEVNLGPLHLLQTLVDRVFDKFQREFRFKCTATGAFVSQLKNDQIGAAIHNRRVEHEKQCRFPCSFWRRDAQD